METLNFTQFCARHGYPCDYDTMFQAQILGSRGLAGSVSTRSVSKQDDEFHQMQAKNMEAHALFYDAVKKGDIIDSSGELTQEGIIEKENQSNRKSLLSELEAINSRIRFIESLGGMSHLSNGKLKKNYQMQVNDCNDRIIELNKLIANI